MTTMPRVVIFFMIFSLLIVPSAWAGDWDVSLAATDCLRVDHKPGELLVEVDGEYQSIPDDYADAYITNTCSVPVRVTKACFPMPWKKSEVRKGLHIYEFPGWGWFEIAPGDTSKSSYQSMCRKTGGEGMAFVACQVVDNDPYKVWPYFVSPELKSEFEYNCWVKD